MGLPNFRQYITGHSQSFVASHFCGQVSSVSEFEQKAPAAAAEPGQGHLGPGSDQERANLLLLLGLSWAAPVTSVSFTPEHPCLLCPMSRHQHHPHSGLPDPSHTRESPGF